MTYGIHHITCLSSDPQATYDFYARILGLRLLKKSVNQDDRGAYHLFFGDKVGSPGMDLTFFPYGHIREGASGKGSVAEVMLAVPKDALNFWEKRLSEFFIEIVEKGVNELNEKFIKFNDWDGLVLILVESDRVNADSESWAVEGITSETSIRNFYGVKLYFDENNFDKSTKLLTEVLAFKKIKTSGKTTIYENQNESFANLLFVETSMTRTIPLSGTVHHIAFRVKSDEEHIAIQEKLAKHGLNPTEVIDRYYFKSIYFREPSGILYEIATDEPGFTVDEKPEELGLKLALPPFIESERAEIERGLARIRLDQDVKSFAEMKSLFKFITISTGLPKTLFLLHGTGADEFDLLELLKMDVFRKFNIVSLRGNVDENGVKRFFNRFAPGEYDQESIKIESAKLNKFVELYSKFRKQTSENLFFLGYSNGANLIFAAALKNNEQFLNLILLHPAQVLDDIPKIKLDNVKAFVSFGEHDQMISKEESEQVLQILENSRAELQVFNNNSGHEITKEEFEEINDYLMKLG